MILVYMYIHPLYYFYSQYNVHVNMFCLPDIYIWTRNLLTLLTKCISIH